MKVRMQVALPAMLALAGCASTASPVMESAKPAPHTSLASPQRVDAVSAALGQRLDNMLASSRLTPVSLTR